MNAKYILLALAWIFLLAGIVFIVLSFIVDVPEYYGAIAIGIGAVLSLVAVILRQREKKRLEEEEKRTERHEKRHKDRH